MEERLQKLEDAMVVARTELATIRATLPFLATKADVQELGKDMHEAHANLLKWVVATLIACAALAFTIARYIK